MKVLFCKNSFAGPISGADEIAATYAIHLKAAGYPAEVLLVHRPARKDELVMRLQDAGVPITSLASPTFSASLAASRRLAIRAMRAFAPASQMIRSNSRKIVFDLLQRYQDACREFLERTKPDVIHVLTPDPGAVMLIRAAHATGIPVVYQEVGIPFHPPGFEEVYERFVSVLPLCAAVVALSPRLADEMNRVLPHLARPRVIPLISQDTATGTQIRRPQTPQQPVRFGFAARLEHLKGALPLIEAFRIAHLINPSLELKIAGDGSLRPDVAQLIRSYGLDKQVTLTGVYTTLQDRGEFMRSIDVFVLPSLTEGTPNAIIEAMAHSVPIIATNVGGIPDVVTEDVGILVPPNDTSALGSAMAALAQDLELRRKMGQAARRKYEVFFTPNAVLPLLTNCYAHAMNGHLTSDNAPMIETPQAIHPWSNPSHI